MKGSSPILPGLAPPVQIQPQQQSTHFSASSILASQLQSCRRVRQYTIRLQRQDGPGLDNELQVEFLGVKDFPSSFHGDGKALKQQIPWSKEHIKNAIKSYPIRGPKRTVDVQCFTRPFHESHRPRGNCPFQVTQLPAKPPRTFLSANVDLNNARDVNAPGELDQSTPSSPPDFVSPGWKGSPVPTGSSLSEHRSSRTAQESTSFQRAPSPANQRLGQRFGTSSVVCEEPLPTTSQNRKASSNFYPKENLRTIEAKVKSENVMTKQAVLANVYSPSRRRVQQAFYEFRDPWRLKKSRIASEPHNREAQSAESCRPVREAFNNYQGATGRGNDVAQMEIQSPQSSAGAAKWTETANVIEQNRDPSHNVLGLTASLQQTSDSLIAEPNRAVDRKASRTRNTIAKGVLEIRQLEPLSREKEGHSSPISQRGMTRYSSRGSCPDTPQRNGTICIGGSVDQAVAVLQNRLQRGVTTDSRTYVKVLQMCLKQKDLLGAKQVHRCIIESGMDKNSHVAVTLLNVYIKCGELADARQLFDQLEKKTVVTWTNMIAGYTQSNHAQPALEIFNEMRQEGVQPNEITYLSILKACASPSAIKWGKEIHECIRQDGFESDVRVGTALLSMYSKCGCILEARQVFENLTNRNIITWNTMIGALAQHGHGHEAHRMFLQMKREALEPNAITYVSVLNASASVGALEWVKEVHGHARKAGLESDMRVGSSLVHMYAKSGSIDDARLVFDRMEKRDVVTWNVMIGGLALHGCGHEAYRLFLQMIHEGFKPDAFTVASILNPSASAGALEWVKEVHGHASKVGLESDMRVGSALVHMYAKSGSIDDAQKVFERMEKRDVVTWTVMIGGLAEHGHGHEAYRLFLRMIQEGFEPDAFTLAGILNPSASAGALEWVKEVHGHARKGGLESDMRVGNALVNMYAKSGSMDDARKVFERMEQRDVFTWTVMIGGLAEQGCGHEAYRLFLQMIREGCEPDAIAYVSVLNASASAGALEWVKEVHGHASKAGLESDMRVGNALVHMYAKSGSIDDSRQFFDRMEKRDVVTWNAMIGGLAEHGHGHEAYLLFLRMRQEGFEPNAITYISILNASASVGALEWVKEVHGHATKAGLHSDMRVGNSLVHMYAKSGSIDDARLVFERMEKRDIVTWNVMIGGLSLRGCGHEAFRLFLQMRQEGFEPNAITYISILNASASVRALEWVKEVHGHASKAGLESDMRVGNALVHMYAKSGSIDDARLVFERMEKRDVVTWNVMIGGLALHGCGHEALQLFRKMTADLLMPDETTFVVVLSACCHSGLVDDGHRLFSAMTQDYGIEPNIWHYNCMVDLIGRAGHLEEARLFIKDMPVEPDAVTWKALLGACRTYGNVELGELAAEEVFKLEPSHAPAYVLLSNIYAAAGRWENVSLVRTMMQTRGVRKEPGRSWIEVDKKIHEFVVGDTSHPEAKAIYNELNNLTEKLKAEGYVPDTRLVLHDISEEDKELALCSHSEKLAIAYGLMRIPQDEPICVWKNLRVCPDCHTATKLISKATGREIIARDASRFHHFKDGICSCGDYW